MLQEYNMIIIILWQGGITYIDYYKLLYDKYFINVVMILILCWYCLGSCPFHCLYCFQMQYVNIGFDYANHTMESH